jgi:hypothetical protein
MLSWAIKICLAGWETNRLCAFSVSLVLVFLRAYRFSFYTCLDKMLERWAQRRVPRGHGLAIVGNLYSLFSSKRCVCLSLLLYYSTLLSEGWILVSRVDVGKRRLYP